jgi:hypothetical protein
MVCLDVGKEQLSGEKWVLPYLSIRERSPTDVHRVKAKGQDKDEKEG